MSVIPSRDSTQHWAPSWTRGPAAANVVERICRYRCWLKESGRALRMTRSWRAYYGFAPDGNGDTSQTGQSGDQGEYVDVTTNDFATLVTQTAVLTTQNKPALHAIATNADFDSLAQTEFAQGLLEFYDKKLSVQDRDFEMVLIGLLSSEGWEIEGWDATGGKSLTDFVADAPALNEGDIRVHSTTLFQVTFSDFDAQDIDSLQWIAFKRRYNRFDLAKTIELSKPDVAEKLRAMSSDSTAKEFSDIEGDGFEVNRNAARCGSSGDLDSDLGVPPPLRVQRFHRRRMLRLRRVRALRQHRNRAGRGRLAAARRRRQPDGEGPRLPVFRELHAQRFTRHHGASPTLRRSTCLGFRSSSTRWRRWGRARPTPAASLQPRDTAGRQAGALWVDRRNEFHPVEKQAGDSQGHRALAAGGHLRRVRDEADDAPPRPVGCVDG